MYTGEVCRSRTDAFVVKLSYVPYCSVLSTNNTNTKTKVQNTQKSVGLTISLDMRGSKKESLLAELLFSQIYSKDDKF